MKSDPFANTSDEAVGRLLVDGSGREDIVVRALQECQAAIDAGKSIDREAMFAKYPEIRTELSACLDGLELMGQPENNRDIPAHIAPLATLGDFRIVREIGRGGMGVVYEAEQLSIGRSVALKVLPYAAMLDRRQIARFQNEARAAATLEHPHIVPVYFVGNERGVYYYAMRLIEGKNLAEVMLELDGASTGEVPISKPSLSLIEAERSSGKDELSNFTSQPETVRDLGGAASTSIMTDHGDRGDRGDRGKAYYQSISRLGKQVAEALDFAHSCGIVHRDIKPANIMLDEVGDAWITDFGLARIEADVGMTMTGDLIGTLRYMSPEQTLAKRITVDHRSDVYSLGATLYELLTLQPIYSADDRASLLKQIAFEDPKSPSKIVKNIPKDLETIILKALEKDPDSRYPTAKALSNDLHAFLENRPILAKPPNAIDWVTKWIKRNSLIVWLASAASMLIGLVCAIALVFVLQGQARLRQALSDQDVAVAMAKQAVDDMYVDFAESWLKQQSGLTKEQAKFVEKASTYYEQISSNSKEENSLDLALTLNRLSRARQALGDHEGAVKAADRAVAVSQACVEATPKSLEARTMLISALQTRIEVIWAGGGDFVTVDDIAADCKRCVEICESTSILFPKDVQTRVSCAYARVSLGATYIHAKGGPYYELWEKEVKTAYKDLKLILEENPNDVEIKRTMLRTIHRAREGAGRFAGAGLMDGIRPEMRPFVAELDKMQVAVAREILTTSPRDPDLRELLARSLAVYSRADSTDELVSKNIEATQIWGELMEDFPNRGHYKRGAGLAYQVLGSSYMEREMYTESNEAFLKFVELMPAEPYSYIAYRQIADNLVSLGRLEESWAMLEKAAEVCLAADMAGPKFGDLPKILLRLIDHHKNPENTEALSRLRSLYREMMNDFSERFGQQEIAPQRSVMLRIIMNGFLRRAVKHQESELGETALEMLESLADRASSENKQELTVEIQRYIAECHSILGRRDQAISGLRQCLAESQGAPWEPKAKLLLEKLLLENLPEAGDADQ